MTQVFEGGVDLFVLNSFCCTLTASLLNFLYSSSIRFTFITLKFVSLLHSARIGFEFWATAMSVTIPLLSLLGDMGS